MEFTNEFRTKQLLNVCEDYVFVLGQFGGELSDDKAKCHEEISLLLGVFSQDTRDKLSNLQQIGYGNKNDVFLDRYKKAKKYGYKLRDWLLEEFPLEQLTDEQKERIVELYTKRIDNIKKYVEMVCGDIDNNDLQKMFKNNNLSNKQKQEIFEHRDKIFKKFEEYERLERIG